MLLFPTRVGVILVGMNRDFRAKPFPHTGGVILARMLQWVAVLTFPHTGGGDPQEA